MHSLSPAVASALNPLTSASEAGLLLIYLLMVFMARRQWVSVENLEPAGVIRSGPTAEEGSDLNTDTRPQMQHHEPLTESGV